MYTVQGLTFHSFEEMVWWVYNTFKISWEGGNWDHMTEQERQAACVELDDLVRELDEEVAAIQL